MQSSLLIVDSIATNRVALKVKLSAAWYQVNVAATGEDAINLTSQFRPNLILVNNTLPDMHVAEISARLKAKFGADAPPLLALSEQPESRESLLRSAVEDVLPLPVDEGLLIARIRSILRARATEAEWRLQDCTTRALGFAEPVQLFEKKINVACLHSEAGGATSPLPPDTEFPGMKLSHQELEDAMRNLSQTASASVIVLNLPVAAPGRVLSILSDLRANPKTRHCAILAAVPQGCPMLAAQSLDLGADDATVGYLPETEMMLRLRRLHARREINQDMRKMVKSGVEAATRDPLTGLFNRRYAIPQLERIAEQSRISRQPYAVMVADLDHFKRINDWFGHDAGDIVLVECAKRMRDTLSQSDLLARFGGEEFLFVLPNTDHEAARETANRLCQAISETDIKLSKSGRSVQMTVSIGLALSPASNSPESDEYFRPVAHGDLLTQADKALYKAKEMGRNRFMLDRAAA